MPTTGADERLEAVPPELVSGKASTGIEPVQCASRAITEVFAAVPIREPAWLEMS